VDKIKVFIFTGINGFLKKYQESPRRDFKFTIYLFRRNSLMPRDASVVQTA
jgi:hypothetical protein